MIKTVLDILDKNEKIEISILVIFFIFVSILELLSIGFIYPIIYFVIDNSYINNFYYKKYLSDFGFTKNEFIAINLIFLICLYFIKNLFIFFVKYKSYLFRKKLESRVSAQVLKKYFFIDYERIYKKTTEQIFRNVTITRDFSSTVFSIIGIFQEGLTFILLLTFLTYLNYQFVFIIILVFGLIIFLFHKFGKNIFFQLGMKFQVNMKALYKVIFESIGAIKLIKLFGKEQNTLDKIVSRVTKEGNIRVASDLLIQLPSHVIEVVAVICLSFLIFLILLLETSTVNIIAIIAIFAAAITRIMPASTRMIHHIQSLRYYLPRLNIVRNELRKKTQDTTINKIKISGSISFNKHIELKNISFFYKKKDNAVFSNLNLKIKKMETIGILGPSGSGKSTLNNIITGLLKPKNGKVNIDEVNIDVNLNDWQKKIGFVPQQPFFTNDTIKKNIIFTENTSKINTKLLNRSIKYSQLGTLIKELPLGLNTRVGERGIVLSSGQLQRISIARALYRNPQLLILDEATNALDAKNEKLFFESVRNLKGKLTVIINSHQKHNFYFCDKIYEIKNKKLKKVGK